MTLTLSMRRRNRNEVSSELTQLPSLGRSVASSMGLRDRKLSPEIPVKRLVENRTSTVAAIGKQEITNDKKLLKGGCVHARVEILRTCTQKRGTNTYLTRLR